MRGPNRHVVAISTINTVLATEVLAVAAGDHAHYFFEIDLTTADTYTDLDTCTSPEANQNAFFSSMGHLLEIFAFTDQPNVECWVDFAIDGSGSAVGWRRAATLLLSAGVLGNPNPIRIPHCFGRVTFANNHPSDYAFIDVGIKVKSA